jgi:cytochrome bd-type quinol oxidase subunit 2
MRFGLSNVIIAIACIILIILLMLVYLRSRQGDQRIIRAVNQTFFPLLSAILITLGIIFSNQGNSTCAGIPNILRYATVIIAILIIAVGVLRFILSRRRDRRLITHPVLFAIMIVFAVFAVEQIYGCVSI